MSHLFLVLILAAADASPAADATSEPELVYLVLKTRQKMEVRSYEVAGRLVKGLNADGQPFSIRADMVDLEASAKLTETARKRAEAATEAAARATAAAEAAQAEREARREAEERARRQRTSSRGGFTVSGREGGDGDNAGGSSTEGTEDKPGDGPQTDAEWAALFAELRGEHRSARSKRDAVSNQIDSLLSLSNTNTDAGLKAREKIRELRSEMATLDGEMRRLESEYQSQQGKARAAGVPAAAYREGIR